MDASTNAGQAPSLHAAFPAHCLMEQRWAEAERWAQEQEEEALQAADAIAPPTSPGTGPSLRPSPALAWDPPVTAVGPRFNSTGSPPPHLPTSREPWEALLAAPVLTVEAFSAALSTADRDRVFL